MWPIGVFVLRSYLAKEPAAGPLIPFDSPAGTKGPHIIPLERD